MFSLSLTNDKLGLTVVDELYYSMKHSGYSGTPLNKKLGIKPGFKVCTINAPKDYLESVSPLPEDVMIIDGLEEGSDLVHVFIHSQKALAKIYPDIVAAIHKNGMIWISWPKGASKVATDLNRDFIREYVLDQGLVDVKVASYDDIYGSLKFVYRKKDR